MNIAQNSRICDPLCCWMISRELWEALCKENSAFIFIQSSVPLILQTLRFGVAFSLYQYDSSMKEPCAKHQMLIKMPTIHRIIINFAEITHSSYIERRCCWLKNEMDETNELNTTMNVSVLRMKLSLGINRLYVFAKFVSFGERQRSLIQVIGFVSFV